MIVIEVLPKSKDIMMMRLLGGRGVLGDGLGALRHGVLGKLTRQDQTDSVNEVSICDGL